MKSLKDIVAKSESKSFFGIFFICEPGLWSILNKQYRKIQKIQPISVSSLKMHTIFSNSFLLIVSVFEVSKDTKDKRYSPFLYLSLLTILHTFPMYPSPTLLWASLGESQDKTECVNSLVGRFARKLLLKFPRPVDHTTAAVQPSKKTIAGGIYTKTF